MQPSPDTTQEAARIQVAALRHLSVEEKIRAGIDLSDGVRRRIEIGVRERHPGLADDAVQREVVRIMLGDELFDSIILEPDATG